MMLSVVLLLVGGGIGPPLIGLVLGADAVPKLVAYALMLTALS